MFAEELGGNASRKRAEEAKAKRLRLKEQLQAKQKVKANIIHSPTKSTLSTPVSTITSTVAVAVVSPSVQSSTTSSSSSSVLPVTLSSPQPPSGVPVLRTTTPKTGWTVLERAAQQRELRSMVATEHTAVLLVQKHIRGYCTRYHTNQHHQQQLLSKLNDWQTLFNLLQIKATTAGQKSSSCIPPPTTAASSLLCQFLFGVTSAKVSVDTTNLFTKLLRVVVLPGMMMTTTTTTTKIGAGWNDDNKDKNSANNNLHNCLETWCNSAQGQYRLRTFLQRLLQYAMSKDTDCAAAVLQCLRILLLGTTVPLQSQCRSCLLFVPPTIDKTVDDPPALITLDFNYHNNSSDVTLDLMGRLRQELLWLRDKPIPDDVNQKRDASFSVADKQRAGALYTLTLEALLLFKKKHDKELQARFVKEILTLPILSWRVASPSLSYMMSTSTSFPNECILITLLRSFTEIYSYPINAGEMESILASPDLPMTLCAATGTQRLLANLMQFGRHIPACTGSVITKTDFTTATTYFQIVAALVNTIPLGTFITSRESAIVWMSSDGGGTQKAIVLSPIILEQCQSLLVDQYVRRVVQSAIDTTILCTDVVLNEKNEKDRKHEKDLHETKQFSAATLAANQVKINAKQGFWNSSKWAQKLSKGVSKLLHSDSNNDTSVKKNPTNEKLPGQLFDTSKLSRKLAEAGIAADDFLIQQQQQDQQRQRKDAYSIDMLLALLRTYSIIIARWGGGGNFDLVSGQSMKQQGKNRGPLMEATFSQEACVTSLLNVFCFSTPIVQATWGIIQSDNAIISDIYSIIDPENGKSAVRSLSIQPIFAHSSGENEKQTSRNVLSSNDGAVLLYTFLCAFSHVLIVTDDVEIHGMDKPIPIHQMRRCIQILKKLLYRSVFIDHDERNSKLNVPTASTYFGIALIAAASRSMKSLYDRSSRRPICVPSLFVVSGLLEREVGRCKTYKDYQNLLSSSPVLRVCPYMVSFKLRLKLFERIVTTNRIDIQGENSNNPFHNNPLKPGISVRITRGRILEDGLATMNNLGSNMRQRISVHFYNQAGTKESGIDAGGLFKEFFTDLCAIAFDPNYALFKVTESGTNTGGVDVGNCLYPNPSSAAAHGSDHIILFLFLGRILGKSLYEGITINPRFAHFFLSFLKGDYNFLNMLPDLGTIDPQLYSNLLFLKNYEGDASDLCLTFTVTVDEFGGTREIPLIPNGANVDVTNNNKQHYIGLVAKHYIYDRLRDQSEAMTKGLFEVVDRSWLHLFNEPELQVLISGVSDGKLDVEDLKAHTNYVGGFSSLDRTINRFWSVVESLTQTEQRALLRFVTSCERPPPLGFGCLNPPFTIHRVGILRDGDRLPAASTCFNTLKLPTYSSEKVLKQRLLYAIQSGAGFELS